MVGFGLLLAGGEQSAGLVNGWMDGWMIYSLLIRARASVALRGGFFSSSMARSPFPYSLHVAGSTTLATLDATVAPSQQRHKTQERHS